MVFNWHFHGSLLCATCAWEAPGASDAPTEPNGHGGANASPYLEMYYEIEGTGDPLVYIPPAFGYAGVKSFPALVQGHSVITVDLQGHGHTADIPERPITFEQHAKDVVGLVKYLGISKADFFGESFGGVVGTMIAVHYPEIVGRVATYAATFGAPQIAVKPEVLRPNLAPTPDSRGIQFQRENYKKVAPDPDYWPKIWGKVLSGLSHFLELSQNDPAQRKYG
jgi:pimeloyl-ACP methyl ester carboxylesterase